jgi:hypothetical protein
MKCFNDAIRKYELFFNTQYIHLVLVNINFHNMEI